MDISRNSTLDTIIASFFMRSYTEEANNALEGIYLEHLVRLRRPKEELDREANQQLRSYSQRIRAIEMMGTRIEPQNDSPQSQRPAVRLHDHLSTERVLRRHPSGRRLAPYPQLQTHQNRQNTLSNRREPNPNFHQQVLVGNSPSRIRGEENLDNLSPIMPRHREQLQRFPLRNTLLRIPDRAANEAEAPSSSKKQPSLFFEKYELVEISHQDQPKKQKKNHFSTKSLGRRKGTPPLRKIKQVQEEDFTSKQPINKKGQQKQSSKNHTSKNKQFTKRKPKN